MKRYKLTITEVQEFDDELGRIKVTRPAEIPNREPNELCTHPYRAVFWNPGNQVVQCHRCGETIATRASSHPEGT